MPVPENQRAAASSENSFFTPTFNTNLRIKIFAEQEGRTLRTPTAASEDQTAVQPQDMQCC